MEKPVFSLIAVSTIDGKIAKHARHMSDWSSKEDKDFLHKMLGKSDVAIVGNNTYEVAQKPLSKRNVIVFTRKVQESLVKSKKLIFINPQNTNIAQFCEKNSYKNIAVLGGAKTFNYFLNQNLVNEIFLTIEPIAFGSGIALFDSGDKTEKFELVSLKKLNKKGTVLLHYRKK